MIVQEGSESQKIENQHTDKKNSFSLKQASIAAINQLKAKEIEQEKNINKEEKQQNQQNQKIQKIDPDQNQNSINFNGLAISQTILQNKVANAGSAEKQKGSSQCNCKKSKCLKMYCECFAIGNKCCENCKCQNCQNTKNNLKDLKDGKVQEQAQKQSEQIKKVKLPKDKACNCKKSFCLKKYCQCFTNGIACNQSCKCEDCKNTTDYQQNQNSRQNQNLNQLLLNGPILSHKISNEGQQNLTKLSQKIQKPKQKWQQQEIQTKIAQIMKLVPHQHEQSMLDFLVYMLS